jgi:hydrogenase expression/formation protein HypD
MKYVEEFRKKSAVVKFARAIAKIAPSQELAFMEVCGTHTQSVHRFGLAQLLPKTIRLISGPGCPVCVSAQEYIDEAIAYAQRNDTIVVSFGDMLRVPGTSSTLEQQRGKGAKVGIVYSPWDALRIAIENPKKKVIFLAVGFETTIPTIALTILQAHKEDRGNLFFFTALKCMPPVMRYLLADRKVRLDGFLCPGHVSTIIGANAYNFIPRAHGIGCCVAGFEPVDILEGIYMLTRQVVEKNPRVDNQYTRVVTAAGNTLAQSIMHKVFEPSDVRWRGLGMIPGSGLSIKKKFARFDAVRQLPSVLGYRGQRTKDRASKACRCGDVLKGICTPRQCPAFAKACVPGNPLGPCMVSSEGACNVYYRYK